MLQQPQVFRHEENNLAAVAKVESVIARELNSCARMELSVNPKRFAHSKNSRPSECSDGLCYACAFFSLSSFAVLTLGAYMKPFRRPYHFGGSNKMIHPPSKSGSASKFRLHT